MFVLRLLRHLPTLLQILHLPEHPAWLLGEAFLCVVTNVSLRC